MSYGALPSSKAFTDRVASAQGRIVDIGRRTISVRNFTPAEGTVDGGVLGPAAAGLVGRGRRASVIQVRAHSSTRARSIPKRFPHTNQLSVLRVTGAARVLEGFTVRGTAQGHLYNGLRIDRVRNLRASRLRVEHIPGDDGAPPGETFGINDYRTVGSRWSHVVVDGDGVGASGFGVNGSKGLVACDVTATRNTAGMGFAFWQSSDVRLVDCRAIDNGFSGFNFERSTGRTVLVRPQASGNKYGMRIASDRSSARFVIVDPVMTNGVWTVTMPRRWYGTWNHQRRSDITLIVHGRSRPDLLRFETY
ncbi:right-handed parallel beta-helix repeat-containing protein [Amnibacterium setariae]|uniref:Right-handed parallel beta-helix repeat-containing protein n=1 Tax=Amnibacterium setariae TaxID=2306585 RepID=A0A3A1TYG3_9MICO|nr:right-handed parallel beta-helix repeat-containing protein [Amnibacterium setariae]RIX28800.1 right-handed parallel beta-helix repeat-containing protein [Amnibacterium setariae]